MFWYAWQYRRSWIQYDISNYDIDLPQYSTKEKESEIHLEYNRISNVIYTFFVKHYWYYTYKVNNGYNLYTGNKNDGIEQPENKCIEW